MKETDLKTALQAAFTECERYFVPLTLRQKEILLQLVIAELTKANCDLPIIENPLDKLTPEELEALLDYVQENEKAKLPWKIKLLNDWLHEEHSGSVQFIREVYGFAWLNQVKPLHIAHYLAQLQREDTLRLKVGDSLEVSNGLWEWVQKNGVCPEEWFPCTVIEIFSTEDYQNTCTNCIIRFKNGAEYEIQGIYQWNRHNWRWSSD